MYVVRHTVFMFVCVYESMDGWKDRWMGEGRHTIYMYVCMYLYTYVCMYNNAILEVTF